MAKLTAKQKKFVEEYLIDLNATQAAIRAGYSTTSAGQIGGENLKKHEIKSLIDKNIAERSKRTGINQDRILLELAKMAFVNIHDIVNDNGEITSTNADDLACIESIKVKKFPCREGEGVEREIKIASKQKALKMLGDHLGMWKDEDENQSNTGELDNLIKAITQSKKTD